MRNGEGGGVAAKFILENASNSVTLLEMRCGRVFVVFVITTRGWTTTKRGPSQTPPVP
jgi:hypothetical protein